MPAFFNLKEVMDFIFFGKEIVESEETTTPETKTEDEYLRTYKDEAYYDSFLA